MKKSYILQKVDKRLFNKISQKIKKLKFKTKKILKNKLMTKSNKIKIIRKFKYFQPQIIKQNRNCVSERFLVSINQI